MERFMTTEEVAEILRIDAVTVRRLIMRGELVAYRIAGEYRVAPGDLEKFVESQRVVVNAASASTSSSSSKNQPTDKFTDQARRVLSQAGEEVQRYNHSSMGTDHLLLALMNEDDGIAAQALARLQVQPTAVRARIETLHPAGEQPVDSQGGMIPLTPQAKSSIELAVQEARALDHHYLGTEHLLLGIVREEKDLGGQALRDLGVQLEDARTIVRQLLTDEASNE